MAEAAVTVIFDSDAEPLTLHLKSGEEAEVPILNRSAEPVECTLTVRRASGLSWSLVALQLGGETLYVGRSTAASTGLSRVLEPGASTTLTIRFIAPRTSQGRAEVDLELRMRPLLPPRKALIPAARRT